MRDGPARVGGTGLDRDVAREAEVGGIGHSSISGCHKRFRGCRTDNTMILTWRRISRGRPVTFPSSHPVRTAEHTPSCQGAQMLSVVIGQCGDSRTSHAVGSGDG